MGMGMQQKPMGYQQPGYGHQGPTVVYAGGHHGSHKKTQETEKAQKIQDEETLLSGLHSK
jgi:hypothetical protein